VLAFTLVSFQSREPSGLNESQSARNAKGDHPPLRFCGGFDRCFGGVSSSFLMATISDLTLLCAC